MSLTPLGAADLRQMVAETLRRAPEDVAELTSLIEEKTGGNPFSCPRCSRNCTPGKCFVAPETGGWRWGMDGIRAMELTDNVVDLMAGRIGRLDARPRQALRLAACIGNRFELSMLAAVAEQSPEETSQSLWEALRTGLLLPSGSTFRFLHDRVQQAA